MIRQDWSDIDWLELEETCPKNVKNIITTIVNYAEDIEDVLNKYGSYDASDINEAEHENLVQDVISLRSKLNTISLEFLKLLKTGFDDTEEKERKAFHQVQAAFSKLFSNLQELEKSELMKGTTINHVTTYISTLDTVLYGLIYHSLKNAIDLTKDPKMFSIELWKAIRFSFDVFRYQLVTKEGLKEESGHIRGAKREQRRACSQGL